MPIETARQISARNVAEIRGAIRIIRRIEAQRRRFAAAAVLVCFASLAGYALDLRLLYLPLAEGGGTHPLTAVVALLLASARLSRQRRGEVAFTILALGLLAWRAAELLWQVAPLPLERWLDGPERALPRPPVELGHNTLMALAAISAAILLRHRTALGMAALVTAFGICGTVIVAYSYALDAALGGMSPVTTLIALLLALACLSRHLDPMALRLLLSDSTVSRMLRRQLLLAMCGFWIGGLLLLQLDPTEWVAGAPLIVTVMLVVAAAGLMSSVAMLSSAESERQRHQAALERLSVTDALTGLANRWACDLFASRAVAAARREGTGLSVVLIDIDRFKLVNDRFGHAAGDRLLREVGHLLPRWLRRSDLAARWGGEEFLLILTTTRLTGAMALAERVRRCFEDRLTLPDGSASVTASIGCAELLPHEETIDAAISRADAALYRAKNGGRNRVEPPPARGSRKDAETDAPPHRRRSADRVDAS
jgi:diguanylate cyclase (GGDEF)-like protein